MFYKRENSTLYYLNYKFTLLILYELDIFLSLTRNSYNCARGMYSKFIEKKKISRYRDHR